MIQYADESLKSQIKEIWEVCFQEDGSYIDFFFKEYFNEETTLVYMEKDVVVSMLTLMPAKLRLHTKSMDIFYVYAVATRPEYQGKGYSSKLLDYVNKEKDNATFLMPATKNLELFYEKNGYYRSIKKDALVVTQKDLMHGRSLVGFKQEYEQDQTEDGILHVAEVSVNDQPEFNIQELTDQDAAIYKNLREESMQGNPYIEWNEEVIAYAIKENSFTGGKTLLVNNQYLVMYREFNSVMYIREHTMPDDMICDFIKTVINQERQGEKLSISFNPNTEMKPNHEEVVMTKFEIDERNVYFNLAFE